ncbi:hypothetical protein [Terricaulis sp.]|uniref:hypothetical protein n=1 Tax=Terricaulis sp. TaxID=2768686 RepID=UPI0037849104
MRLVRLDTAEALRPVVNEAASFKLAFSEPGRRYYGAVFAETLQDRSCAVTDDTGPLLVWECDEANGVLQRFGNPVEPWWRPGLDHKTRREAARMLLGALDALGPLTLRVRTSPATDPDGLLASLLQGRGASCAVQLRSVMDLTQSEDALEAGLRSSIRRHVRWGRSNLTLEFVDAANPNEELFHAYRELHRVVAGRVTRPLDSWIESFEAIRHGEGDLVLCRQDGELAGGVLIADAGDTAFYATGVFERDRFEKPIGHWPQFVAALRAKARGRAVYDVGEVFLPEHDVSEKERAIGYFKSGFSSTLMPSLIWTSTPNTGSPK